ncbi:MAG: Gmad2 immunoglobulin-like domain-containing protein [Candidatus Pacebacteria bacterium]|nr:Gmad2 immunoglobulin-like domain-containing protein [Candidatus Paceibacterota bacterium]
MTKNNKILLTLLSFLGAFLLVISSLLYVLNKKDGLGNGSTPSAVVASFEECLNAGYEIMESYPRQCRTPDGEIFVEEVIPDKEDKSDLIRVDNVQPNDLISSPLKVTGEARGTWFFEGSFPVRIYDKDKNELGVAVAQAKADWMTTDFVPFEVVLRFKNTAWGKGSLVFEKENPSDIREYDDSLEVPVDFGTREQWRDVSLYYYSSYKDEKENGYVACSESGMVVVGRRVLESDDVIEDTIKLLLEGVVTDIETTAGISSEFPLEGLKLENVSLSNEGVLSLAFDDPDFSTSGGSCRVNVLRLQIEKTAKQFVEVKSVEILPEGGVFQP